MKTSFKNYQFSAINIKRKVAVQFREYSREVSQSHTETLKAMLDFFEMHQLSPFESLGDNMQTLESKIKKRINALIAIIKDIEKKQTKPTHAILQLLFKEAGQEEVPILLEREREGLQQKEVISAEEENGYYKTQYFSERSKNNLLRRELEKLLEHTRYVRGNFGAGYFKLELSKEELEQIKKKWNDVHHDLSPKTGR